MINNGTYNKGIYWPKEVQKKVRRTLERECTIYPTKHLYDRLKQYDLPDDCWHEFMDGEVVECEAYNGVLTKIVTRTPSTYYPGEHNCAAIVLEDRDGKLTARVMTVWINRDDDNHRTIRKENYVCGFARA